MPIFNLIVRDNSGEKRYFEANIGMVGTPDVSSTGLTAVGLDTETYYVENGAVFDASANTLTLPMAIKGFSETANSETLKYAVGDALELSAGDNTIYAVVEEGGGQQYD